MKRHSLATVLLIIATLVGCSSFNNSFNTYTFPSSPPSADSGPTTADKDMVEEPVPVVTTTTGTLSKTETKAANNPCPVSPWPGLGQFPPYPYQALLAAGGDLVRVEKIYREHTNQLRAYISERRKMTRESMDLFQKKCVTMSKD